MAGKINPLSYHEAARACGFYLSGIAPAMPQNEAERYIAWMEAGYAGEMRYLTDRRAEIRMDPRTLLPSAKTVLCLGMLYNGPEPKTDEFDSYECGWISRYAWGQDYHRLMWDRLGELASKLHVIEPFEFKVCCDTAPLLERTYARAAGLGWIGKNTCLIHEGQGSWFFLGEILISLDLPVAESPAPDRCGTCTRCIETCPTQAIVPLAEGWAVDARRCISYFTIELRGTIPEEHRAQTGQHLFGCDICQDVCPWNRKAPVTTEQSFAPAHRTPSLEAMAQLTEHEFRSMFRDSPVNRARYSGFLRNVALAMGNSGNPALLEPLRRLAGSDGALVAEHARWALTTLLSASTLPRVLRSPPIPCESPGF